MDTMHSLLKRQIKRHLGEKDSLPKEWKTFIDAVNEAYSQMDIDREMLERSLELSSQELLQANSEMRAVYQAFPDLFFRTDANGTILDYKASGEPGRICLEKAIGSKITGLFPADTGKKFSDAIARVGELHSLVSIEYSTVGQDSEHYYEARLLPLIENQIIIIIRNITDRKYAERALRDSENLYRTIFENTGTAMVIVEGDNRISLVNTEFVKQFGFSADEIEGKNWTEFIAKNDLDRMKEYYRLRQMDPVAAPREYEIRVIDKNGQLRNVYITVSLIPGTDRRVASLLDLTEIKRMENALRESEQYLRWITENMKDLVLHVDAQGVIRYRLPMGGVLLGYSPEEVLGRTAFDFIHPDEHESAVMVFLDVLKSGKSRVMEWRIQHHDGHYVWMEIMATALVGDGGENVGVILVCRDITERKRAEDELRESEQRLHDIFDFLPDATFAIDLEGTIIAWNRAIEEMTGVKAEGMLGRGNYEYSLPFYGVRRPILIDLVFKSDEEIKQKYRFVKNEGDVLITEADVPLKGAHHVLWGKARPLYDSRGNIVGAIESIRDITENKKLEAQFLQAQKMEAIGTLAGGIAHDFNNLLMGIAGHTSLMLFTMNPDHPHYEKLKSIEEQVKSGAELSRQLLGFARRGKYDVKPLNLNEIIEKTATMFGRTKREVIINRKFQQHLWTSEVDKGQIEQVLLNIYVNAWQAMTGGGYLYLETQNIILDESFAHRYSVKPGRYVKISVTDTGAGMDEKTRERIFDPFFTTKEMGRGTGLGLASAYGIIKGHGGFINVYSEKSRGTTFGIYLPASEKEIQAEKMPVGEVHKGHETILLVDDEDMIINVSREILETLGYNVIVANNGEAAIETYREKKDEIDLVILDMIMPGIGGGEVFDILKTSNPRIKVILSSGYSVDGRPAKMLERGCSGFIQKPYTMSDLSHAIRTVLDT
jgi:PAS domain S-box-containing protein